jgi:hypothetical protein
MKGDLLNLNNLKAAEGEKSAKNWKVKRFDAKILRKTFKYLKVNFRKIFWAFLIKIFIKKINNIENKKIN